MIQSSHNFAHGMAAGLLTRQQAIIWSNDRKFTDVYIHYSVSMS